jgi:radical SAM superfamily enzyme YgiQ (UPF0313 family)
MRKIRIFLGDCIYINASTKMSAAVPLNIGYIASFTKKVFGKECDILLFKDPGKLLEAARLKPPDILGLSSYFWNLNLGVYIAKKIKTLNKDVVVAIGGPNVDIDAEEQLQLYKKFDGNLDCLVVNEGEVGFANVVGRRIGQGCEKFFTSPIDGCTFYRDNDYPVGGKDIGLTTDLAMIPSPILNGMLDEFLTPGFLPLIQTSRMCPYQCSYCCSGKSSGKIRAFPEEVVKMEIEYIAKKYIQSPHIVLELVDENFGVSKRDELIADYLIDSTKNNGYPLQIFCYNDKKFSATIKSISLKFFDAYKWGLVSPLQSLNEVSLKAVGRVNVNEEDYLGILKWVREKGITVATELIFGFPYETKESMLKAVEFLLRNKVDSFGINNLFLLDGMKLNRKRERDKFSIKTKYRTPYSSSYGIVDKEFLCESEQVVVSGNSFSFSDYMDIRKIALLIHTTKIFGFYRKVIDYLVDSGLQITQIFAEMMDVGPHQRYIAEQKMFVDEFVEAARCELSENYDELCIKLKKRFSDNKNQNPVPERLNTLFGARLVYQEKWFDKSLDQIVDDEKKNKVYKDLMMISNIEWVDLKNLKRHKEIVVNGETLKYLGMGDNISANSMYSVSFSLSTDQYKIITEYNKTCSLVERDYYFHILNSVYPREILQYQDISINKL